MRLNNHFLILSVFLKLFLSVFTFQSFDLQAETPIHTTWEKHAKDSVVSLSFGQNYISEVKKRQLADGAVLFFETYSFTFALESLAVVDIPLIAHHKRCFTKKTKSRSPPPSFHRRLA